MRGSRAEASGLFPGQGTRKQLKLATHRGLPKLLQRPRDLRTITYSGVHHSSYSRDARPSCIYAASQIF